MSFLEGRFQDLCLTFHFLHFLTLFAIFFTKFCEMYRLMFLSVFPKVFYRTHVATHAFLTILTHFLLTFGHFWVTQNWTLTHFCFPDRQKRLWNAFLTLLSVFAKSLFDTFLPFFVIFYPFSYFWSFLNTTFQYGFLNAPIFVKKP